MLHVLHVHQSPHSTVAVGLYSCKYGGSSGSGDPHGGAGAANAGGDGAAWDTGSNVFQEFAGGDAAAQKTHGDEATKAIIRRHPTTGGQEVKERCFQRTFTLE